MPLSEVAFKFSQFRAPSSISRENGSAQGGGVGQRGRTLRYEKCGERYSDRVNNHITLPEGYRIKLWRSI